MDVRKEIMILGWIASICLMQMYVFVMSNCLSTGGSLLTYITAPIWFGLWVYIILMAYVSPCPFKMLEKARVITGEQIDAAILTPAFDACDDTVSRELAAKVFEAAGFEVQP